MADSPVDESQAKEPAAPKKLKFQKGNEMEFFAHTLLDIARKLDNIQNHTATLVDVQLEEQEKKDDDNG